MTTPLFALENPPASELSLAERQTFLERLKDIDGLPQIDPLTTRACVYEFPFYPDKDLVVLTNARWRPEGARLCFMRSDMDVWHLNGTSPPVHEMNARTELVITEDCVLRYLAFFCFFVRGEDGPFLIVDRPSNSFLPADKDVHGKLVEVYRAARRCKQTGDGDWHVTALVYYSHATFLADFLVHLSGMIEMLDDHPVAANLAAKVDAPLRVDEVVPETAAPENVKTSSGFDLWAWLPERWRKSN